MSKQTRKVLVCAPRLPEFDREGGSRRVFHVIKLFQRAGWKVSFAAVDALDGKRYARILQQMEIPTFALVSSWDSVPHAAFDELLDACQFEVVVFSFWTTAEIYTPIVRRVSPSTKVIVDSQDLNFLRQSRHFFSNQRGPVTGLAPGYGGDMVGELNAYASADAVLAVSQKEADLINDLLCKPLARVLPLMEDSPMSEVPFSQRKGMVLVGNFRHLPNAQAVEYFCGEILPRLSAALLERHPVYVIGNEPSDETVRLCARQTGIRLVGWVPLIAPYLEQTRISLVPLLSGAGTKTKLIHSLMMGTPGVSTPTGIEGLNLRHDEHVVVAADADAFAKSIERLIDDERLWERLARQGREFISATHGPDAVYNRLCEILGSLTEDTPAENGPGI